MTSDSPEPAELSASELLQQLGLVAVGGFVTGFVGSWGKRIGHGFGDYLSMGLIGAGLFVVVVLARALLRRAWAKTGY